MECFYRPSFWARRRSRNSRHSRGIDVLQLFFSLFSSFLLGGDGPLALLQEVITPVAEVEHGKDGGEDDSGDDVDFLGPGGKFVQPGLEEVLALP